MKAVVNTKYGPPEVLRLEEVEKPFPKDNEVLIKIYSTTVNRTDCGFKQPEYFIVRLINGLLKPKKTLLGSEMAGEIEATGKHVKTFKPGDQVFGLSTFNFGTHAEYICMSEENSITAKPANMSYDEAAAACDGAFLALLTPLFRGKKVLFPIPRDRKEDIVFLKEIIEAGKYKAVIDRTFSLEQIAEAARYVETGQKTGNVVIKVANC
jgi:NADPH:quinone reductase-like Zn-dependent oxidoreductase